MNRDRLEQDLRRFRGSRTSKRSRLGRWGTVLAVNALTYLVAIPLITGDGLSVYDPSRPVLWYWLAATVIISAGSIALSDRAERRGTLDVDIAAERITRTYRHHHDAGWIGRTVKLGLYMGLAIGAIIGLLMVAFWPIEFGEGSARWKAAGLFCVATVAWTIPMSFVIRWISLKSARKYVSTEEA